MWETWVWSLGWEDPLEEGMATHPSILDWRIPRTEEPGGLQSTGLQRARLHWKDLAQHIGCLRTWTLTPGHRHSDTNCACSPYRHEHVTEPLSVNYLFVYKLYLSHVFIRELNKLICVKHLRTVSGTAKLIEKKKLVVKNGLQQTFQNVKI